MVKTVELNGGNGAVNIKKKTYSVWPYFLCGSTVAHAVTTFFPHCS